MTTWALSLFVALGSSTHVSGPPVTKVVAGPFSQPQGIERATNGQITVLFSEGTASDGDKLYANDLWAPNPRIYDAASAELLRVIDISSAGCQENVTPSEGGLAVSNGVIYVACADRLVKVDTLHDDAVSLGFVSEEGTILGVHATAEDGVYVTAGRHVMHYNAAGELTRPFADALPTTVDDIIRVEQIPASMFMTQMSQAPVERCPNGGLRHDLGNDRSDSNLWFYVSGEDGMVRRVGHVVDGVLDADEIKSTTYECLGANGEPESDALAANDVVVDEVEPTLFVELELEDEDDDGDTHTEIALPVTTIAIETGSGPISETAGGCAATSSSTSGILAALLVFGLRRRAANALCGSGGT